MGTVLVQIKIKRANKPCVILIARYYSVEEAMNIAQYVFPEALNISCINMGAGK